jgi:hypothetical protein
MRWWILAALVIGLGCASIGVRGRDTLKPRQMEAVRLVWESTYGRTDEPPTVLWVEGAELTCTDPNSGLPGFKTSVGCREGYTATPDRVSVAWREGDRFSTTTLAHELRHAADALEGIIDPSHVGPQWRAVDAANAMLDAVGL